MSSQARCPAVRCSRCGPVTKSKLSLGGRLRDRACIGSLTCVDEHARTLAAQRCSVQAGRSHTDTHSRRHARAAARRAGPVRGPTGEAPGWRALARVRADSSAGPDMVGWRLDGGAAGCVLPAPQARAPLLTFTHPPAPLFHGSRSYYSQGSHHGSSTALNNSQRLSDGPWRHLGGAVAVVTNNK
jgi:hypothetical protein